MYTVRILKQATNELEKLDKPVGRRIIKRITWLVENLDRIKPERLAGNLKGFYKLREGDYRIIYQILHDEKTVMIHSIGHRREIYRKK
ncbi:type II toxin-antitoxin system RelE/ParE family toxin [bacterium]|nr:type II toxin-antitoxin system RelE/ParE family toxin [bacterium]NUM74240.1 type II toxin-antitoxin system RelE/ParE family toxin [candidate division KSB1 bacterium]